LIGNLPAACMGDPHVCPMFSGPKPHTGGTITKGSATVLIGNKPAARVSDLTVCTSEPGQIAKGEMTVLIGDLAGGGFGAMTEAPSDEAADDAAESVTKGEPASRREAHSAVNSTRQAGPPEQRVGTG